jgi:hypothetical protein
MQAPKAAFPMLERRGRLLDRRVVEEVGRAARGRTGGEVAAGLVRGLDHPQVGEGLGAEAARGVRLASGFWTPSKPPVPYCAVRNLSDSPDPTAQSGGRVRGMRLHLHWLRPRCSERSSGNLMLPFTLGTSSKLSGRAAVRLGSRRSLLPGPVFHRRVPEYPRHATRYHLGPNRVIWREHGFNSSAAPPLNGLKNSTDSTDSFSALGARDPHPGDTASRRSCTDR